MVGHRGGNASATRLRGGRMPPRRRWTGWASRCVLGAMLAAGMHARVMTVFGSEDAAAVTESQKSMEQVAGPDGADATASPAAGEVSAVKRSVLEWLGQPAVIDRFGEISDRIWEYAELGLQEHRSSALLIQTLTEEGFSVEQALAGMPTCFVASYGSGRPVIGVLAEYDALPMLSQQANSFRQQPLVAGGAGHGCGHNQMAASATAAVIAVKRAMEEHRLSGTIKLFGSPGEELLVSRPYMIRAGLFENVDAVINNHTAAEFRTDHGVRGSAIISAIFTFTGKTAHSAGSPWSGRSALDAVEIMNVAANFLREHLHFSHRLHYVIPHGGGAPNVVPDTASVWYFMRSSDQDLMDMFSRVQDCARGAALATGTTLASVRVLAAAHQAHHNKVLAELMHKNIELVGMPNWTPEEEEFVRILQAEMGSSPDGWPQAVGRLKGPDPTFVGGSSSDHGDVTLVVPTATIRFPGIPGGLRSHHWSVVACGRGAAAHKGLNAGAKAMAATAVDLLTRPDVLAAIQQEFKDYSASHPYQSFLPADAVPPVDFFADEMNRSRPVTDKASSH